MARTIAAIQASIITAKAADPTLSGLTSTSNSAIWLLWTWVVATCQWTLETLFDAHVAEVNTIIAAQKPHTLQWYAGMAKNFQYGDSLVADADYYNPVVPAHQLVAYAACIEQLNYLQIKVAKLSSGTLAALASAELTAFTAYMHQVKDAGVRLVITSGAAEVLVTTINIFYDATIMKSDGTLLSTGAAPIPVAIASYLNSIPFNGVFTYNNLVATLQAVPGVVIADVALCQSSAVAGSGPYFDCSIQRIALNGYFVFDTINSVFTYTAQSPII